MLAITFSVEGADSGFLQAVISCEHEMLQDAIESCITDLSRANAVIHFVACDACHHIIPLKALNPGICRL